MVVLQYDAGACDVRIFGIDPPGPGQPFFDEARPFLTDHLLDKEVRTRFKFRNPRGEMVSRLWVGETEIGPEMLRAGLARREPGKDEKYGELAEAEGDARRARRGLWSRPQPTPR